MSDALTVFETRLRGQLIRPQDPRYEDARKVYNGMIDRRPQLIARCTDIADYLRRHPAPQPRRILSSVTRD